MSKINILINTKDLLDRDKFSLYLKTLKFKELETYKHSIRVSRYSVALANKLGFSEEEVAVVWISALLHDIGKIFIPNYVLLGTSKLSEEDYILIRRHPIDGFIHLKEFTSERVCKGSIEHHERLDGKGYPYGAKNISTIGRIIAIADTFDAMTSKRTYQNALSFENALFRIQELTNSGLYDKEIFFCFKEVIEEIIKND